MRAINILSLWKVEESRPILDLVGLFQFASTAQRVIVRRLTAQPPHHESSTADNHSPVCMCIR